MYPPYYPRSNVPSFGGVDLSKYVIKDVPRNCLTDSTLLPNVPPRMNQPAIGKYLVPITRELEETPPRPTINEISDKVLERWVDRDRAYWVDKPGVNDYNLHDTFEKYDMRAIPTPRINQAVFPRSYLYELECMIYRRRRACQKEDVPKGEEKGVADDKDIQEVSKSASLDADDEGQQEKRYPAHCRDCSNPSAPFLSAFQLKWSPDIVNKRWKNWPDLSAKMTPQQIEKEMKGVGLPYMNEACNWYNRVYPSPKYDVILRKFSK